MARQRQQRLHPVVALLCLDVTQERVEHDFVLDAPLATFLFLTAEVGLPQQLVVARAQHIAAHIGEVDVATIIESILIASLL